MDNSRFDHLARSIFAAGSRRGLLGGLLGLAVAATPLRRSVREGDGGTRAAPGTPPSHDHTWPACDATRREYCVEALSVGGVDQLTADPDFRFDVRSLQESFGHQPWRFEWALFARSARSERDMDPLPPSAMDQDVRFVLRTGHIRSTQTTATAARFRFSQIGDAATGWVATITGRPGLMQAPGSENPEQATFAQVQFSGMAYDYSAMPGNLGRTWGGGTANGTSGFGWMGTGFSVQLFNPHLGVDGQPTHATYSAWVSPEYLGHMNVSLAQALAGGLVVTRTDEGVPTPVASTLSEFEGGVLLDIPDMTFSSPIITLTKAAQGGGGGSSCQPKCKKGRVCKQDRCKKKKKKR